MPRLPIAPVVLASLITCVTLADDAKTAKPAIPDDVQQTVAKRVENGYYPSIVVGIVTPEGMTFYAKGLANRETKAPADEHTIYEIGSITKTFTATILADMVEKGEVKLDDPIAKYLPDGVTAPTRDDKPITLLTLANHTSGLPRMPDNFTMDNPLDPYADYTADNLYAFLKDYELPRDIGAQYEYSNLGAGLLGQLLARKAGTTYEQLMRTRIGEPLGLRTVFSAVPMALKKHAARAYSGAVPVSDWSLPALAGAGDLVASGYDLLRFVAAHAGIKDSPLKDAMIRTQVATADTDSPTMKVGLGWHIRKQGDRDLIWHNGGTGGFRSFCGFTTDKPFGCVVLTNTGFPAVDDIGFHLLDASIPMETRWEESTVPVASDKLDACVGFYELRPGFVLDVRRQGDFLTVKPTGQPVFTLHPTSENDFKLLEVEASCTFERDEAGKVTGLVWHQNGADQPGPRVEDYAPPAAKKAITVAANVLERYVGEYRLSPMHVCSITRKGDQLFAQLTGQSALSIYPESETEFFYKAVEAAITFTVDEDGKATQLTLHQNGRDMPALRVEE